MYFFSVFVPILREGVKFLNIHFCSNNPIRMGSLWNWVFWFRQCRSIALPKFGFLISLLHCQAVCFQCFHKAENYIVLRKFFFKSIIIKTLVVYNGHDNSLHHTTNSMIKISLNSLSFSALIISLVILLFP